MYFAIFFNSNIHISESAADSHQILHIQVVHPGMEQSFPLMLKFPSRWRLELMKLLFLPWLSVCRYVGISMTLQLYVVS